jgi:hypothetical protein
MNATEPQIERSPDELDALLRAFFRSEMPDPWPAVKIPPAESAYSSWWTASRSRLALAASVALLMLGSWWLAGNTANYTAPVPTTPGVGSANPGQNPVVDKVKKDEEKKNRKMR